MKIFTIFLVLACALPIAAADTADDQAIQKLVNDFAAARNARDAKTLASFYAKDGEWLPFAETPPIQGRDAIESAWSNGFANIKSVAERHLDAIKFIRPDVAVVRVDVHFSLPPVDLNFVDTYVVEKNGDKWEIAVHVSAFSPDEAKKIRNP